MIGKRVGADIEKLYIGQFNLYLSTLFYEAHWLLYFFMLLNNLNTNVSLHIWWYGLT